MNASFFFKLYRKCKWRKKSKKKRPEIVVENSLHEEEKARVLVS